MFLSVGHDKNVIYSKLVNNPFKILAVVCVLWVCICKCVCVFVVRMCLCNVFECVCLYKRVFVCLFKPLYKRLGQKEPHMQSIIIIGSTSAKIYSPKFTFELRHSNVFSITVHNSTNKEKKRRWGRGAKLAHKGGNLHTL